MTQSEEVEESVRTWIKKPNVEILMKKGLILKIIFHFPLIKISLLKQK